MDYLTVKEAAAELKVGVETIRRLIRSGELRATSLEAVPGRAGYRIRRTDLEALLEARARGGTQNDPERNAQGR